MLYLSIFIFIILLTYAWGSLSAAPWVPTRKRDLPRIFSLLKIKAGDNFIELGAGNGLILQEAAKRGTQACGYEISLFPYFIGKIRNIFSQKKFTLKYRNFWSINLKNANIVYFFLLPDVMPKISQKLKAECQPGTKVISYVFAVPDLKLINIDKMENRPNLYLYEI